MAEGLATLLIFGLLLAGVTLVAFIATMALRLRLRRLLPALGVSTLLMAVLLLAVFPGSGVLGVLGLAVLSHLIAGGVIRWRERAVRP